MPPIQQKAEERQRINDAIRAFFRSRGFIEVETPILVQSPDLSPNLMSFETTAIEPDGKKHPAALITSPEFSMKKLLGHGMEKIFTLTKVFRNKEEFGGIHHPEFTMLEWYRQGADYHACMDETETLVLEVFKKFKRSLPLPEGELEGVGDSERPFRRIRICDLFLGKIGIDLDQAVKSSLVEACGKFEIHTDPSDTESDLYYRLFLSKIEPELGKDPIFIYDYPAFQAALSKLTSDGKYGQRFELYINGLELCNAFTELTDPVEQRKRFEIELAERKALGKPGSPVDEDLLGLLPSVRQPTYGNALGVDRLHMLVTGRSSIEDVLLFPASTLFS